MRRHCTVTAVWKPISPCQLPRWSRPQGGQGGRVNPSEGGCSTGCPGMTIVTYRRFVQVSPQSIWFETHRWYQAEGSIFFPPTSPQTFIYLFFRSSDGGSRFLSGESDCFGPVCPWLCSSRTRSLFIFFMLKKAQTVSVSSDIHVNLDRCHMTFT